MDEKQRSHPAAEDDVLAGKERPESLKEVTLTKEERAAQKEAKHKRKEEKSRLRDLLVQAESLGERPAEVIPLLEELHNAKPENAIVIRQLADAYWKAGRTGEAFSLYYRLK